MIHTTDHIHRDIDRNIDLLGLDLDSDLDLDLSLCLSLSLSLSIYIYGGVSLGVCPRMHVGLFS